MARGEEGIQPACSRKQLYSSFSFVIIVARIIRIGVARRHDRMLVRHNEKRASNILSISATTAALSYLDSDFIGLFMCLLENEIHHLTNLIGSRHDDDICILFRLKDVQKGQ
eukprot:scaffold6925_cov116-Cylindrotheca_fusiformis.AAC.1